MKQQTDAALVAATQAGDQASCTELVRRYEKYTYGTAIAILADLELAQDIAQDAFVVACGDLTKLEDPERFGPWLRGIVRNLARAALRERIRLRKLSSMWGELTPAADFDTPEGKFEQAERRQIVRRALERISRSHRDVLCLHYLDGLSYVDVARCLDLSVTVVKGRLQRGRQRLQSELTIVEEHFMENQLPSDFAEQIQRLLKRAASGALQDDAVEKLADMGPSVIEALCDALTDERKWVRHVAVLSLCEIGDTRALHPVMRLLHFDPGWVPIRRDNGWVDREVLSRVLSIPGCRVRLLETVRECDQHTELPFEERQALHHRTSMSLHALSGATGDEEAYDTVARLLDAPHPHWLRGRALHTLCDIKPDDAPDLISQRLKTGDEAMYEAAFEMAVPHRAVTRAVLVPVAACVHTIDHGPVSIKGRAVSTLCQHGSTGRVALDALLSSASRATSAIMASTLARMGDPTGAAMLEEGLLGTASGRDGFVPWGVRHGLEHRNEPLRVNLWTLALRYPECAGDLIEGIYEVGGPNWKRAALKILCRKKGPAMLPELRRHLASGRPHHNLLAKEAFWQMLHLGVAAASTASEMFDSDDWKERKAAVGLMRRWGTLTETQQKRAADDPHIAVQHAAGRR